VLWYAPEDDPHHCLHGGLYLIELERRLAVSRGIIAVRSYEARLSFAPVEDGQRIGKRGVSDNVGSMLSCRMPACCDFGRVSRLRRCLERNEAEADQVHGR
jgi:hypothetical protein